jgi:hypothetical protein
LLYRVEVRVPGWDVPWILSNSIYVFPPDVAAKRRQRGAWPPEPAAPPATVLVDSFDGATVFQPAHDSRSSVSEPFLDPVGGADGKGAARLRFRLGIPDAGYPHTYCAMVNQQGRDLTGRTGLVFAIKGDGVYRIWVQVRDDNPVSADDGMEFWFASVRASTEWRRVAVIVPEHHRILPLEAFGVARGLAPRRVIRVAFVNGADRNAVVIIG